MTDDKIKTITVNNREYRIYSLQAPDGRQDISRLPYSLKILLENLLRHEDGSQYHPGRTSLPWSIGIPRQNRNNEISFTPARVLMQDFTGVPAVLIWPPCATPCNHWAATPKKINPLSPAELVIDHSVMVDVFGTADAAQRNAAIEFKRNRERYEFLRWGQQAFSNFKVVPPDTGIVHQSTWNTWPGRCSPGRLTAWWKPTPIPWWAPIPIPR